MNENDNSSNERATERLTKEEELELFAQIQKGDRAARNKLIESCKGFLIDLVGKYSEKYYYIEGFERDELMQEGFLALYACYDKFKPDDERGARFSTYVYTCIENKFKELLRKSITYSKAKYHQILMMKEIAKDYYKTYHEVPSEEELAELMGISKDALAKLRLAMKQEVSYEKEVKIDGKLEIFYKVDSAAYRDYAIQGASEVEEAVEKNEFARSLNEKNVIDGWLDSLEDDLYDTGLGKKVSAKLIIEALYGWGEVQEKMDIKDLAKKLLMSEAELNRIVTISFESAKGNADIKQLAEYYFEKNN